MSKTKQPNINSKKPTKKENSPTPNAKWVEDYVDCFSFKQKPISQEGLERFASDITKWAYENSEALSATEFPISKGIGQSTYYKWVVKYPIIKQAHETVMHIIGLRREHGAIKRIYSEKMILHNLHQYSDQAREASEFHASLKSDVEAKASVQYIAVPVGIPNFGSSAMVPEKKAKDEPGSV
jgi:hypothetical protein